MGSERESNRKRNRQGDKTKTLTVLTNFILHILSSMSGLFQEFAYLHEHCQL